MRSSLALYLAFLPGALSTASPKRGLVDVSTSYGSTDDGIWTEPGSDLTWYYNYGDQPSPAYAGTKLQFVPMLFTTPNSSSDTSFVDSVTAQIKGGANITSVLGFNEPDGTTATGGSSIAPDVAAQAWIQAIEPLKHSNNLTLGGPAVTGSQSGFTWLQSFFSACAGNCSVDFLPVHWYGSFEGLAGQIGQVRGTYPNVSIWVTEYALPNANLADSQSFFNSSADYFDRLDYVDRYSYFGSFRSSVSNVGPNAAMLTQQGKLTDIGAYYLNIAAQHNIPKGAAGTPARPRLAAMSLAAFATIFLIMSSLA